MLDIWIRKDVWHLLVLSARRACRSISYRRPLGLISCMSLTQAPSRVRRAECGAMTANASLWYTGILQHVRHM
jgi:hypothetical protein